MNLRDQFFMHGHLFSSWQVLLEFMKSVIIIILAKISFCNSYIVKCQLLCKLQIFININIEYHYFYYNYSEVYCYAVWKYKFTALEPWFSNFSRIIYWFILKLLFTNQPLKCCLNLERSRCLNLMKISRDPPKHKMF